MSRKCLHASRAIDFRNLLLKFLDPPLSIAVTPEFKAYLLTSRD